MKWSFRSELPVLRFRQDRRTIAFLSFHTACVAGGFLFWHVLPLWPMLLLSALTSLGAFIAAVVVHNAIHAPLFAAKKHNRWMQCFLSVAYGHPVSAYVSGHNLSHHLHTQSPKDVMRTHKARFRWNLLNAAAFFFVVFPDIQRANTSFAAAMKAERPGWHRQYRIEIYIVVLATVALALVNWKAFLLFFVLPHAFGGWGIVSINYLQHDGADPESPYNHSRDFTGRLLNWCTFNNGFHTIHHLHPGLHWSLLPAAHHAEVAPCIHPGLPQPSLLAYLWRSFVWPGNRVDFTGQPVALPPKDRDQDWIPGCRETPGGVCLGVETEL